MGGLRVDCEIRRLQWSLARGIDLGNRAGFVAFSVRCKCFRTDAMTSASSEHDAQSAFVLRQNALTATSAPVVPDSIAPRQFIAQVR